MPASSTPFSPWRLDAPSPGSIPQQVLNALPIEASVPGTVHTDLLAAALIPDPYLDSNELELDWIGRNEWRYSSSFEVKDAGSDRFDLVFDGLDTLATVIVNGTEVAQTANQHRRYRFAVEHLISEGVNTVSVTFASAWGPAERAAALGLPDVYSPHTHIRKMACNFGWDWGPVLVTAGIWRHCHIERWSGARLSSTRPCASVLGGTGIVELEIVIERNDQRPVIVEAAIGGFESRVTLPLGELHAALRIEVPEAELWWPVGMGEQPLYGLSVRLVSDEGVPLDARSHRIGFRSLQVDTTPDEHGVPFVFSVNGRQIPIRGVNWIPDDCFLPRVDRERIAHRLSQAVDANVNLVRVWGGGVYESDDFYDVCDEKGILVWQDFLFAVAAYPESPELDAEVEAEARDNVERLMPHPSLALWNGNNENFLGYNLEEWKWKERLAGRPWGETYYLDLLPGVVADVDPTRSYWPGSPYSGDPDIFYNDPSRGLVHLWDEWNQIDYANYRRYPARFVSEFGWQGPPTWSTLARAIQDDPLQPDSAGMSNHQKATDGNGKLTRGLEPHFPAPTDFRDWHFSMQLNQARAVSLGIEHFRALRPLNMGTILWQLNDCWPVVSWSVVDGDSRLKPAWYALRASQAPQLVTVQPRGDGLVFAVVDDGGRGWAGAVTIRRVDVAGNVLASQTSAFRIDGLEAFVAQIDSNVAVPGDPQREFLTVETPGAARAFWFFVEDREFAYDEPVLSFAVTEEAHGATVTVTAQTFVRDLCLLVDQINPNASVDDMLVTVIPGESATFFVTGATAGEIQGRMTYPVVRSANDAVLRALRTDVT